jgi:hypothetical protein
MIFRFTIQTVFLAIVTMVLMPCEQQSRVFAGQDATVRYAQGFSVETWSGCKLISVKPPWQKNRKPFQYLLVPRGNPVPSDHRVLLPATALMGALVALAADLMAQLPGSQAVLPLNAVTALIGTPVIVWLILRRKNLQRTFGG